MHWNNLNEFLAMGGYAAYVWGSFGATFLFMGLELWLLRKRRLRLAQMIKQEVF